MGVYTIIYAPIFNYYSMSQVIPKFESGGETTQPKLYKRGNEDINLDQFSNEATIELQNRLANSRLKDKEKNAVRTEFRRILDGMYDGTFTYKIGGGYSNSVGLTNAKKGFDAAGIAAGILGDVLRGQSVYTAPKEKTDPSKIVWNGNSSIGKAVIKRLSGSDTINLEDFMGLDYNSTTKKVTGNAQRSQKLKSALEYVRDNFDNIFTSFTDKTSALQDIESAINILSDNNLTENEYLDLGRTTGITNLRKLFADTSESSDPDKKLSEDNQPTVIHTVPGIQLARPISLKDSNMYGQWSREALDQHLKKLDDQTLFDLVNYGLSRNKPLYINPKIVSYAGLGNEPVPFTNKYIISRILEILRQDRSLNQYSDSTGNQFYIKGSYNKKRGTGAVYNIANGTISEVSVQDIPWFVNHYSIQQIPSNKSGGVLKFQGGGTPPWYAKLLDYDPTKYTYAYNTENLVDGNMSDETFAPYISSTAGQLQGRYTPTSGHGKMGIGKGHFNYTKGIEEQAYYQNFGKALLNEDGTPTDVGIAWMKKVDELLPENSPARFFDVNGALRTKWSPSGKDAHGRSQKTYTNLADYMQAVRNDQILGARHNVFLNEGNRYFYKDSNRTEHWVDPDQITNYVVSENPIRNQWSDDKTIYWHDYELTGLKSPESIQPELQEEPKKEQPKENQGLSDLEEILLRQKSQNSSSPKEPSTFLADLLGAGRLLSSLYTNNKVYNTILPSLEPVLKNTYERYSPITGAFSQMQLMTNKGNEVFRQAQQPFTTDASLASARLLEGKRQDNQLAVEGFLADDKEIKRTQAEALSRQEDNIARRTETANFNRASINQANRERAQLKATKLKSNWQSWDNFLSGIESRRRSRYDEDRERAYNFYDKIDAENAQRLYADYQNEAYRAAQEWLNDPDNKNKDITEWPEYTMYKTKVEEAQRRAQSMMYESMAKRYGWSYNNPWKNNLLFFDRGWKGRYLNG